MRTKVSRELRRLIDRHAQGQSTPIWAVSSSAYDAIDGALAMFGRVKGATDDDVTWAVQLAIAFEEVGQ